MDNVIIIVQGCSDPPRQRNIIRSIQIGSKILALVVACEANSLRDTAPIFVLKECITNQPRCGIRDLLRNERCLHGLGDGNGIVEMRIEQWRCATEGRMKEGYIRKL